MWIWLPQLFAIVRLRSCVSVLSAFFFSAGIWQRFEEQIASLPCLFRCRSAASVRVPPLVRHVYSRSTAGPPRISAASGWGPPDLVAEVSPEFFWQQPEVSPELRRSPPLTAGTVC
ncbi:hypothetical protein Salat_2106400 [Sesamum alatum]|uniref:Uncharacterized protein n=1 Tax=Sesamum alatum TaxID=300844 RepID=A0AAE1Y1X6_9LAMI|nr:hypothetical protein Salat_2106400 [Sesamum alatum]